MSNGPANATLRIMAVIEGTKGVLVLAVGLGLFALVHHDVQSLAEDLVKHFHSNPARRFARIFLQMAANATDRRLWVLAAGATAYSVVRLVEAYGLWRGWQWTKWYAVLGVGIYVPIEVLGICRRFTWGKLIVLGLNTLVVAYLLFQLVYERRHRTRSRWKAQKAASCGLLLAAILLRNAHAAPQGAPPALDRPWHSFEEQGLKDDGRSLPSSVFHVDSSVEYSLGDLINLAECHHPETRFAWERARAQAATLGLARAELYPALAATVVSQVNRDTAFFGANFYRQRIHESEGRLELSYTVFDFGARRGRISAAKAELLAANAAFNNAHRRVIYQVEQAYYQLLNSAGQLVAAQTSLTNALTVQQAAEDRLQNGLATMPDVLEARSATEQAEYELEAVIGAQDIARGNLAKAIGTSPRSPIHVQPLDQLAIPDTLAGTVDLAIDRSFEQRPDLMEKLAEARSANARVKEARAAYYPTVNVSAAGGGQGFYASQDSGPWVHQGDFAGGVGMSLTWPLFDGGARKSRLARAKADVQASEASVNATRDAVAEEVWRAYSNLRTAFRQRQSALALISAAEQAYAAVLESYNHGVRNFLDLTAAQRALAQARSTDVLARTQVLASLAELAFRTGDSIQRTTTKTGP